MSYRLPQFLRFVLVLAMTLPFFSMSVLPDWVTNRPCANVRLRAAMASHDLVEFEAALADGACLDTWGVVTISPLTDAAGVGQLEMARRLIDKGADLNAADVSGTTALMAASGNDRVEVVELLLRYGAKLSCRDNQQRTALDRANECESTRAAQLLNRCASERSHVHEFTGSPDESGE